MPPGPAEPPLGAPGSAKVAPTSGPRWVRARIPSRGWRGRSGAGRSASATSNICHTQLAGSGAQRTSANWRFADAAGAECRALPGRRDSDIEAARCDLEERRGPGSARSMSPAQEADPTPTASSSTTRSSTAARTVQTPSPSAPPPADPPPAVVKPARAEHVDHRLGHPAVGPDSGHQGTA